MFGLFRKDPAQRLRAEYQKKLERARDLQRGGDIRGYAAAMDEAEKIARQIEEHEGRARK